MKILTSNFADRFSYTVGVHTCEKKKEKNHMFYRKNFLKKKVKARIKQAFNPVNIPVTDTTCMRTGREESKKLGFISDTDSSGLVLTSYY